MIRDLGNAHSGQSLWDHHIKNGQKLGGNHNWEYRHLILVGALEHAFYDFPFSWEFPSIPTVTHSIIFQRVRSTTNQILFHMIPIKMVIYSILFHIISIYKPYIIPQIFLLKIIIYSWLTYCKWWFLIVYYNGCDPIANSPISRLQWSTQQPNLWRINQYEGMRVNPSIGILFF